MKIKKIIYFIVPLLFLLLSSCSKTYEVSFYHRVAIIDSTSFFTLRISYTEKETGSGSFGGFEESDFKMFLIKYSLKENRIVEEKKLHEDLEGGGNSKVYYQYPWFAYVCQKYENSVWLYNTKTGDNRKIDQAKNISIAFLSSRGNYLGYSIDSTYYICNTKTGMIIHTFYPGVRPFYFDENKNEIHVSIPDGKEQNIFAICDVTSQILRDSIKTPYFVECVTDCGRRVAMYKKGDMRKNFCPIDSIRSALPLGIVMDTISFDFSQTDLYSDDDLLIICADPDYGVNLKRLIPNENWINLLKP